MDAAWRYTTHDGCPGALFVFLLAATRQWRATATAGASFLATVLMGALLAPRQPWWYWTTGLLRIGRVGAESALGNLSLVGLAARALGHLGHTRSLPPSTARRVAPL